MNNPARIRGVDYAPSRPRSSRASQPPRGSPTILLSVAGLTPQIITETLYCLHVQTTPPVDACAVHVLTTRVGEEKVREQLLHRRDGWFHRFCRDYRIPARKIRFDSGTIHVFEGADGTQLEDVRTPEDNLQVADTVLAVVRDLTRDPAVALHASVAGGRKTMGLFLGIAFQLLARPQDRLSHVLVSPPDLEGHPEFYYPPPAATTYDVKGKRIRGRDVRLELAEVPVLLLRDRVAGLDLERPSYSALIEAAQLDLDREAAPPPLLLAPRSRAVQITHKSIRLTALEFAVYHLLAERRRTGCGESGCAGCGRCALRLEDFQAGEVLNSLRKSAVELRLREDDRAPLARWERDGDERFLQVRSRINAKIRNALGAGRWADRYSICASGHYRETRYYLPLASQLIRLQ